MLDGVTPFPAEFAARYRELGYWEDRPLFDGFTAALATYADRVALVDADGPVTYAQLGERSARLARVLLDLGFGPLDRIVVQLPNTAVFAHLYFALQRLSGGTTGIPKLIPRSHNDYLYNSKVAAAVCEIGEGDVLLDVLPIEHNLPLGCPGLQGFLLSGGTVVLGTSTRPRDVFELIQRHRVTHIHLVPALLIRWIDDPAITRYDLSSLRVIQSGGQRLQPEVRLRAERALPGCWSPSTSSR